MKSIHTVTIQFPEIALATRDAHKLRGYFGNLFKEHSPLLHNHLNDGQLRYAYPLVQYKVLNNIPTLVGIEEGAKLLTQLFLNIKELQIEGNTFPVNGKIIRSAVQETGVAKDLFSYRFSTLWMGLNQQNFSRYVQADPEQQSTMLKKVATGNMLSFFKGISLYIEPHERIMLNLQVNQKNTTFKNKQMLAFAGNFTTNVKLPNYIGIGKAVSRGFGTIEMSKN